MSSNTRIKSNVKKHIPKDWLCELRILFRLGVQTISDIKRTGLVNIVIVTTMAAILMIFGACFRTALSISSFSKELGSALEISVYLKSSSDIKEAKSEISQFEHVEEITTIPKAVSWDKLRTEMKLRESLNSEDSLRFRMILWGRLRRYRSCNAVTASRVCFILWTALSQ